MSRGFGKIERAVLTIILRHGKPMTFGDMCGTETGKKFPASLERSFRRAVHQLTKRNVLIAMGDDGPGEPFSYFFHPLFLTEMGKTPEAQGAGGGEAPRDQAVNLITSVPQTSTSTGSDGASGGPLMRRGSATSTR